MNRRALLGWLLAAPVAARFRPWCPPPAIAISELWTVAPVRYHFVEAGAGLMAAWDAIQSETVGRTIFVMKGTP